jgi:hypothetical protein
MVRVRGKIIEISWLIAIPVRPLSLTKVSSSNVVLDQVVPVQGFSCSVGVDGYIFFC